jgi:cystathionine beta-lyase
MENPGNKTATQCVHAGTLSSPHSTGVNSPIITSSAFEFMDVDDNIYPRYFNTPNQHAVVKKLCVLEGGEAGLVVSSGMAAISTAFVSLLKPGDHVVMQDQIYGGTYYFATSQFEKLGISYTMVKGTGVEGFRQAIQPNTRLLYFETPSNPLLKVMDIPAMAELAKQHNIPSMIDNTFASPINQNPLKFGVDVVMHSGTKYLGGHSDLCFGALITSEKLCHEMLKTAVNWGGSLDAVTCYQIERSLKTLLIRVQRQNENAMFLARALSDHPDVKAVYFPGLESHPGYELAKTQMTGFGGMLSFELKQPASAESFCRRLKLIRPALSLGGVETIISIPCLTSHIKMTKEERMAAGVSDDLLRLSVGIEDAEDLLEDLLGIT